MKQRRPGEPLFRFLDIDAADVGRYPTLIDDIRGGRADGVIVRGVLPREAIAAAVDRLERRDPPIPRTIFPGFTDDERAPYVLGRTIVSCPPDLGEYFADAAAFRGALPGVFREEPGFEARIEAVFRALSGGRPVSVPEGPEGKTYTSATVRVLPDGNEIGVHIGKSFMLLPQAWHLSRSVDVTEQLSYFVTLTLPEGGGELVVYALEWSDVEPYLPKAGEARGSNVYAPSTAVQFIEICDRESYRPGEGDLLLFDGGRYFHRVSHVRGGRPRRTIGGFLSLSLDHRAVSYWS